jgi:hypothetical protein
MYALTTAAICGELPLPFFESFKTICVDTEGQRDAVEKAIEHAGGRLRQNKVDGIYITFRSWDVTVAGHPMSVDYMMMRKGDPRDVICSLASEHNEDDSISAIIKWVGVAPDTVNSASHHTARKFRYQQQGDSRLPWPTDKAVFGQMLRNGQLHTLRVSQYSTSASVSIHWDIPVHNSSRP